jgi:hypothetical protein
VGLIAPESARSKLVNATASLENIARLAVALGVDAADLVKGFQKDEETGIGRRVTRNQAVSHG